ncbi:MAG: hypothetical protein V3R81_10985 [Gammaproteobacteria bacterium]
MANMSFWHTRAQFIAQTKDITRRIGWWYLRGGEVINGIEKGRGIPKGGKIVILGPIKIVNARGEPLEAITPEDVVREGFPSMTTGQFIDFFCKGMGATPQTRVNRIVFRYLEPLPRLEQLSFFANQEAR